MELPTVCYTVGTTMMVFSVASYIVVSRLWICNSGTYRS